MCFLFFFSRYSSFLVIFWCVSDDTTHAAFFSFTSPFIVVTLAFELLVSLVYVHGFFAFFCHRPHHFGRSAHSFCFILSFALFMILMANFVTFEVNFQNFRYVSFPRHPPRYHYLYFSFIIFIFIASLSYSYFIADLSLFFSFIYLDQFPSACYPFTPL